MQEKFIKTLSNLTVLGLIFGVAALIMMLIPNRYELSIEKSGVLARLGDRGFSESRYININGIYTKSLFRHDVFNGRFIVEGFDFTADASLVTLQENAEIGASMQYINFERLRITSQKDTNLLGIIFFSPKFEYFAILIPEPNDNIESEALQNESGLLFSGDVGNTSETVIRRIWNSQSGLFLSGPANNRSEAIRILNKLLRESPHYDSVVFR